MLLTFSTFFGQGLRTMDCEFQNLNSFQKSLLEEVFVFMDSEEWSRNYNRKEYFVSKKSDLDILDCYLMSQAEKSIQAQFALFSTIIYNQNIDEGEKFGSSLRKAYFLREHLSKKNLIVLYELMSQKQRASLRYYDSVYYLKLMRKTSEEIKDTLNYLRATLEIGVNFRDIKNYTEALKYFNEVEKLQVKTRRKYLDDIWIDLHYANLYNDKNEFNKAKKRLIKSLYKENNINKNPIASSHLLRELGNVYLNQNNTDSAVYFYKMVVERLKPLNTTHRYPLSPSYYSLGKIHLENNDQDTAKEYFTEAFNEALEQNDLQTAVDPGRELFSLLEPKNSLKTRIFNVLLELTDTQEYLYLDSNQLQLHLDEVDKIESKMSLEEEKTRIFTILFSILIPLLILLVIIIYVFYKQRNINKRQKQELLQYNTKLNKSNAKLNDAIAKLDKFSSHVAHDIKSSIVSVQKGLQTIQMSDENLSDKTKYIFGELEAETEQLCDFVDFLLQKAKKEKALKPVDTEFELMEILSSVLNNISKSYDLTKIEVNYDWKLPKFKGQSLPIFQLLKNLIENAIKYQSPDRSLILDLTFEKENDFLTIKVKDNGRGIPAKRQKEIFQTFQQIQKSDKLVGTGVGLSICKTIAEDYGGSIAVDSILGKGSTFTVVLDESKAL